MKIIVSSTTSNLFCHWGTPKRWDGGCHQGLKLMEGMIGTNNLHNRVIHVRFIETICFRSITSVGQSGWNNIPKHWKNSSRLVLKVLEFPVSFTQNKTEIGSSDKVAILNDIPSPYHPCTPHPNRKRIVFLTTVFQGLRVKLREVVW